MKKKILSILFIVLMVMSASSSLVFANGNNSPGKQSGTVVPGGGTSGGSGGSGTTTTTTKKTTTTTGKEDEDKNDDNVVGYIVNKDDHDDVIEKLNDTELILTSYEDKDGQDNDEIKDRLNEAYKELIENKPNLIALCPGIEDIIDDNDELTSENIVVSDIYDVTVIQDGENIDISDDNELIFNMYVDFDEDEDYFFIYKAEGSDEWVVLSNTEYISSSRGGYIRFCLKQPGIIGLVRKTIDKNEVVKEEDEMRECTVHNLLSFYNGPCLCLFVYLLAIIEFIVIIVLIVKLRNERK